MSIELLLIAFGLVLAVFCKLSFALGQCSERLRRD
jgi:hypothetical protein